VSGVKRSALCMCVLRVLCMVRVCVICVRCKRAYCARAFCAFCACSRVLDITWPRLAALGSAPASRSSRAMAEWPLAAAQKSGVPRPPASLPGLAPRLSSRDTASTWWGEGG